MRSGEFVIYNRNYEILASDDAKNFLTLQLHSIEISRVIRMDEEFRKIMRRLSRQKMHDLWQRAKEKNFEDLDDEEQRIARIMVEHANEFHNQLEFADLTYDHEYDPDTESNPFMHITIHSVIEAQLDQKNPIETVQFYNAMRKKKYSRHDAIHMVGLILSCLIFDMMKYKKPFDLEIYRKLLKKYKTRNPDKFMDLLENDPLLQTDGLSS